MQTPGHVFISTFIATVLAGPQSLLSKHLLMISAFFDPADEEKWDVLIQASSRNPITAIIQPRFGDEDHLKALAERVQQLRSNGVKVVGLIPIDFGLREAASVTNDLRSFVQRFTVDGFFLGCYPKFTSNPTLTQRLQDFTALARSYLPSDALILANPASFPQQAETDSACSHIVVVPSDSRSSATSWNNLEILNTPITPSQAFFSLAARGAGYLRASTDQASPSKEKCVYSLSESKILSLLKAFA